MESLLVLDGSRLLKLDRRLGGTVPHFDLTRAGLSTYLRTFESGWPRWEAVVVARLAAWPSSQGTERELLCAVGEVPRIVVRHILDGLDRRDLSLRKPLGGSQGWRFFNLSPRLRRRASA